jgi:hypothetical protein
VISDLNGKDVVVHLGILEMLTDTVKGKVVATNDQWIQVKSKKKLEFILLAAIRRITVLG